MAIEPILLIEHAKIKNKMKRDGEKNVKIFLDGAAPEAMRDFESRVEGFTTNPSLMRQAMIADYRSFARGVLEIVNGKPVSFEVFSDTLTEMGMQAIEIASWGKNIYVKIPVTTTTGESCAPLIKSLGERGIKVNATAIMTMAQIDTVARSLVGPSILSIFCGRIADTGRDPVPFITKALHVKKAETKILWASTREVLNVKQAEMAGADIITMSPDLIKKMDLFGKDLAEYSRETVQQFYDDAKGLSL